MIIITPNNQHEFTLPKKVSKLRRGTTNYSVPKILAVTKTATIKIEASGRCVVSAYPDFFGDLIFSVIYTDKTTEEIKITFTKPNVSDGGSGGTDTPPPADTTKSIDWFGGVANTSEVDSGPTKFKSLRTPSCMFEMNNFLYIGKGFSESDQSLCKTLMSNPTKMIPLLDTGSGDMGGEVVTGCSDGETAFVAMFDPFGYHQPAIDQNRASYLDCFIVAVKKDDTQYKFTKGVSLRCSWQDNPYISAIAVFRKDKSFRPKKLILVNNNSTLRLYVQNGLYYDFDKITGEQIVVGSGQPFINNLDTINNKGTNDILDEHKHSLGTLQLTSSGLFFKGASDDIIRVIAKAQTSVDVDDFTINTYDFNTYALKGCVHFGSDGMLYVSDSGNLGRILKYNYLQKFDFSGQICWVPTNYNCSVDRADPKRVFIGAVELEVTYPASDRPLSELKWKIVRNWSWNIVGTYMQRYYLPEGDNKVWNLLRNVFTFTTLNQTKTLALMDYFDTDPDLRAPVLVELNKTQGLVVLTRFSWFSNVHINESGTFVLESDRRAGGIAKVTDMTGGEIIRVTIPSGSALENDNAFFAFDFDTKTAFVFNPSKDHSGNHITAFQNNKILYNVMPSASGVNAIYPEGDYFDIGNNVWYAGGVSIAYCDGKLAVVYVGEGWGADAGQTFYAFLRSASDGKLITRFGNSIFEAMKLTGVTSTNVALKQFAGNAYAYQLVKHNGILYLWNNCEHGGGLNVWRLKNY